LNSQYLIEVLQTHDDLPVFVEIGGEKKLLGSISVDSEEIVLEAFDRTPTRDVG
jgi:hypothetical protein